MTGQPSVTPSVTVGADGVATLLWQPDGPVFSEPAIAAFGTAVERIASDPAIVGAIVASSGRTFPADADPSLVLALFDRSPDAVWSLLRTVMAAFRRLETCGKPVAAAIAGDALGGGFEMALACHARLVADDPGIRLGLPEGAIGLMPGFGGTQRLPRLVDYKAALRDMARGRTWSPQEALTLGAITEVVPADTVTAQARAWVLANPGAAQRWDRRGYVSPAADPGFATFFTEFNASHVGTSSASQPAGKLIAEAVYHGLQMPIDPGLRLEARRFVELTRDPATRAMVRMRAISSRTESSGD